MTKVLHFFKTYYPETMGGVEQVIFQLAEGSVARGLSAEVLSLSTRGAARGEAVGHHVAHRSRLDLHVASTGFSRSAFKDFAELARQADIIHYHYPWPYMDLVHFASRLNKPTLVSYHSDIVKQKMLLKLYRPLMNRFLGSVDRIVVSSPNYAQSSEVLQRFKDKVDIIPFGLEQSTYPEVDEAKRAGWRKRVGGRFFLFVGALRYYKSLDCLIEAAKLANLPVVIVGHGHLEQALRAQAQAIGASTVQFVGGVDDEDKVALLQLCEGFVFPSHLRSEAFGISLLEAAMYGKPMISCEIGTGTTFINLHGQTGLVTPPRHPGELARAMLELWNDPARAAEMGRQARLRYESVFSADQMIDSYVQLYQQLLDGRP